MANKFRIGDLVTWEHGDGSPDHIVRFGWQYQQAYLSRAPGIGAPVTELTLAVVANQPAAQTAWTPEPQTPLRAPAPAGEWHPDPPKLHTGPEAWTQRG
jgi:hypothetical protein